MNACMNWSMTLRSCTRGLLNEDDGVAGTALARRGRSHAAPATGATPSRGARAQGHPKLTGAACRRSEEHTSELQSLMRISYAVFCLKKKTQNKAYNHVIEHS